MSDINFKTQLKHLAFSYFTLIALAVPAVYIYKILLSFIPPEDTTISFKAIELLIIITCFALFLLAYEKISTIVRGPMKMGLIMIKKSDPIENVKNHIFYVREHSTVALLSITIFLAKKNLPSDSMLYVNIENYSLYGMICFSAMLALYGLFKTIKYWNQLKQEPEYKDLKFFD